MRLETFRARDLAAVARRAEALFNDDVVVLQTRTVRTDTEQLLEVVTAAAREVDAFRAMLTAHPLPDRETTRSARPYVIALVGPTGAGKTTTIAKLASNASAFGAWTVGMITLDTFRVAGLEQLATYAEIAHCPLEVAYDSADATRALQVLGHCDVVRDEEWWPILAALAPDEIHLVIPAGVRVDIAAVAHGAHAVMQPTHALLSKLDDVPDDTGVADLAAVLALPTRWLTDGLAVPADLKAAPQRILASLGLVAAPVAA
jgi:flagellar biosynthesis protein FlhF